jgi:glucosamine--fructose-6-phosphate aminotransferase (isomerizing)
MDRLPDLITEALSRSAEVDDVAGKLTDARDFFFLGRHVGFPMALEGALKLKELAYLRAEGYPAGELKHGPIALIEPGTVVVGIATRNRLTEKLLSNIAEVHSRGATVVLVAEDGDEAAASVADHVLWVPSTIDPLLSPVVGVVPLQQLAYRLARLHGHDVDRPRNLAKTVTVE